MAITWDTQIYAKVAKKINPATLPLEQALVAHAIKRLNGQRGAGKSNQKASARGKGRTGTSDGVRDVDCYTGKRVPYVPCRLDDEAEHGDKVYAVPG